jgi:hypothetical protein
MATARSSGSFNGRFMEGLLPKVDSTGSGQLRSFDDSGKQPSERLLYFASCQRANAHNSAEDDVGATGPGAAGTAFLPDLGGESRHPVALRFPLRHDSTQREGSPT